MKSDAKQLLHFLSSCVRGRVGIPARRADRVPRRRQLPTTKREGTTSSSQKRAYPSRNSLFSNPRLHQHSSIQVLPKHRRTKE